MSYIKKICPYLLLLAVLSGLLSGCITKSDARADPGTSTGTEGTTDPEADSLTRQLEDLRNSLRQQTDSLEARVRALEEALQAGVPAGGNASDFTYEVIDGGIRLTGWTGTGKSLTVPQTVDGKPVTANCGRRLPRPESGIGHGSGGGRVGRMVCFLRVLSALLRAASDIGYDHRLRRV